MKELIQQYRSLGWATIRVQPLSKSPVGAWQGRTDEPEHFTPGENVGVRLGDPSGGLVDVDLDCLEACALAPRFLPETATFGRASKPRSHWLYLCKGVRTHKPKRAHVELRSTGVQTVLPPSIHESSEPIEWTDGTTLATVSEGVLLPAFGRLAAATIIARTWARLEGNKHDYALALAGACWHEGMGLEDALGLLVPAMELDGSSEPHREAAIRDTWADHDRPRFGWPTVAELIGPADAKGIEKAIALLKVEARAPQGDEHGRPLSDLGNAERLCDEYGNDLRFVPGLKWMQWDGTRWCTSPGEPIDFAALCARKLQRQGVETQQAPLVKWGFQSESASRLGSTCRLARDLPAMQCEAAGLDVDPWLLCAPNGTVDLRTGSMRLHERGDMITKLVGAAYEPGAQAPRFARFLREVFVDPEVVEYVLRFLGYSLTGSVREQVFQVWHGHGSNGKSVLVDVIRHVLGDYAQILAGDLLIERRQGRASEAASPDVARLRGCRFAAGVETKEGQRWNESLVKQLTGSDRVVARHLHCDPIEFDPTWKLVLAVNHKPIVRGTDRGMWRRIHLVPFEQTFTGASADPTLTEQLRGEAGGILSMLVRACLEWQRDGLKPPARVLEAVEDYRAGQDVIGSFLGEMCKDAGTCNKAKLYQAYRHWAGQGGEYTHSKHEFNNRLRERGFVDERKADTWYWAGVSLRSEQTFGLRE